MDLKHLETLLNALLRRRENSPELVEELNEYVSDLKDGTLTSSDAHYIEALAKRLSISTKGDSNTPTFKPRENFLIEDLGVFFLECMKFIIQKNGATNRQIHDWRIIENWLNCQGRELSKRDKETFSNGFKAYMARGVAPSVELNLVFEFPHKKYKNEGYSFEANLPPTEVMGVFDRLLASDAAIMAKEESEIPSSIRNTVSSLIENDLESFKAGVRPETRLIPHELIKRDIIEKAYLNDLDIVIQKIDQSNISEKEKLVEIQNHTNEVEQIIYNLRRIRLEELDNLFDDMRNKREDFSELEKIIRNENPRYKIVDPL